ncbi:MAG: amidohydrolase family protein [Planctomycetes bacterium]|nr:amidohydrolase family protein [Planctomycetota bacterium]
MPAQSPHNLHALDYVAQAAALPKAAAFNGRIIDVHSHIHGREASKIYETAARLFGVRLTYSQTRLVEAPAVREVLKDTVRFVAIPNFSLPDKAHAFGPGYLDTVRAFREEQGARMIKLWNAPRTREWFTGPDRDDYIELDGKWRVAAAELAVSLGMMIKTHTADPDSWFKAKYTDRARYGVKKEHYRGLEVMLKRFPVPWIAAHMGGNPEDLHFLSGLLERHPNLYLDTSATKWVVRELGKHPREELVAFFEKWQDRIFFGSDIVTMDDQLTRKTAEQQRMSPMSDLSDSPETAFELYASRYFALRTMFETVGDRPSPIADPDLKMVDPAAHTDLSSPTLRGIGLSEPVLRKIYYENVQRVVIGWENGTWKAG